MKPILCVVDLTPSSQRVLEVAATIASACHAHLIVLFSYRLLDLGRGGNVLNLKESMDAKAKALFQELCTSVLDKKDVMFEFHTEIGFTADRIRTYIDKKAVGMVVIGEQQAGDIDEHRSLSLRSFISDMRLPFIIVPEDATVELLHA